MPQQNGHNNGNGNGVAGVTARPVMNLPRFVLPDHTQLPDSDGAIVENFQEHPQGSLLTDSILPILREVHPDGQFAVGCDSGIYWRMPLPPEPLVKGAVAPDWFYVPGVPPKLEGVVRRSYVLWQELVSPLVVLEMVSRTGAEERDRTPRKGKFWVYEQMVGARYYGIFENQPERTEPAALEMWRLVNGRYEPMPANAAGRYAIPEMRVELGLWHGLFRDVEDDWMRWWDRNGNLVPTPDERAERLAAQLRALGIEPQA